MRLGRAQAKLDKAVALQAEARQTLLDTERAHRERMAELQSAMDECTERSRVRRQQLREVQEEVAVGSTGGTRAAQHEAIRRVHSTICSEVGPTIAALVDQLDSATPAWATLTGLLGKLSDSRDLLESACGGQSAAQEYDIGDNGNQWDGWSEWSESHELGGATGGNDDHDHDHDRDHLSSRGDHWGHGQGDADAGQDQL